MKNDIKYLNWSEDEIEVLSYLEICLNNAKNICTMLKHNTSQTLDNLKYNFLDLINTSITTIHEITEQQLKHHEFK